VADAALVEPWRQRLAPFEGFKIGIHWQGNPAYEHDHFRSIPLRHFAPLAAVPGVVLFSLQKHHGGPQLAEVAGQMTIHDLGPDLDNDHGAFMDTAAVIENLDLVITADSALAHLAGGLGAEVWVALARCAEWRWLLDREDSPWYSSMRLFRQSRQGDWSDVFARMTAEIARIVAHRGR
jgi:ADP-heptose:LPS heptosyltransferase